jgi:hypothetical protein
VDVAARERGREERGAGVFEVVEGEAEVCEGRAQREGEVQAVRGAGLEPVPAEVEPGERVEGGEHRTENGEATVAEVVVGQVEVAEAAAGVEDRDEFTQRCCSDAVAGELEVREARGLPESLHDECGVDGPEAGAAGDFEAL